MAKSAESLGMTAKATKDTNGKSYQIFSMDIIDFYQAFPH
jgi:hypothetical protein